MYDEDILQHLKNINDITKSIFRNSYFIETIHLALDPSEEDPKKMDTSVSYANLDENGEFIEWVDLYNLNEFIEDTRKLHNELNNISRLYYKSFEVEFSLNEDIQDLYAHFDIGEK